MPELSEAVTEAIKATVNPLVTVSNPFDYHTFDWGDGDRLAKTFTACMSAGIGITALIIDFPKPVLGRADAWKTALESVLAASHATGAKAIILASMPEGIPHEHACWLMERGIPAMRGFDHSIAAIAAAYKASQSKPPLTLAGIAASHGDAKAHDERQAKMMLAKSGVSIPEGGIATSRDQAVQLAKNKLTGDRLVVMKAVSAELSHKTELGAVRLHIRGADMVAKTYDELATISPDVLIEDMIDDAVAELIIGVSHDPVVGLYLMLGSGGVMAELMRDTITLMLDVPREQIKQAVLSLKAGQIMQGWRGQPQGDIEAAIDAIMAIQSFALANASQISELEVNPLMVRPQDRSDKEAKGAVAVDALIRMRS
jgi:acyl-CoA synthetase (NDP forming)